MVLLLILIFGSSIWRRFVPDNSVVVGVIDHDGWMETLENVDEDVDIGVFQGVTYETLKSGEDQNVRFALAAQISTGDLDAILAEPETILYLQMGEDDYFFNLEEVYTEEELSAMEDSLLYKENEDGSRYPIAVDLTDCPMFEGGNTGSGMCFAYTITTDKFMPVIRN